MEAYLQKKAGVSLADVTGGANGLTYVEEYDLYFLQHTDTNYQTIEINNVTTDAVGHHVVTYTVSNTDTYVVTLARSDDGWQFVSNVQEQL